MKKYIIIIIALIGILVESPAQTLEDYQLFAAENNPGLQAKHKEFEAAMEKVTQASTLPDPNLSISVFGRMAETRTGPQMARFTLTQMFPWFGTLKANGNVHALMAESKYEAYLDARNMLFYQIEKSYYPLYERNIMESIQKENLSIVYTFKELAAQKFESGIGSLADVIRADIMINEMETMLQILKEKEQALTSDFNNLLNRDPQTPVEIIDTLRITNNFERLQIDSLLNQHPRIKEMNLMADAMKKQEELGIKQGFPMLGLGIDYVIVDKRKDQAGIANPPEGNGQNLIMPMAMVSLPIFRKKYKSAQLEAKLMQEAYSNMSQQSYNMLNAMYNNIVFDLNKAERQMTLYKKQINSTNEVLDLLYTGYSNSGQDFEELLMIQQQLLDYEMLLIETLTEYKSAEAELKYLIGSDDLPKK